MIRLARRDCRPVVPTASVRPVLACGPGGSEVRIRSVRVAVLALLGGWALAGHAQPQGPPGVPGGAVGLPPLVKAVGLDQRLGQPVPTTLVFRDDTGRPVRLGDLFGRRPVLLALVYYRCPMLCSQVLSGLVHGLRPLPLEPAREFDVVVASIDPREGPELAAAKKRASLTDYGRPHTAPGWHFLTGGGEAVAALARAVGFRYVYDRDRDQFAHPAAAVVLTPDGRVARYLLGIEFAPRDLRLSLVEASSGRIGTPVDRVLLFCYRYDPTAGRYSLAILTLVRAAGIATVTILVLFIATMVRRERRRPFRAQAR